MRRKWIALAMAAAMACAVALSACGNEGVPGEDTEEPPAAHTHVWTVTSVKEATCGEAGRIYYGCECGATKTERTDAATGAHRFVDGVCSECGYIDMSSLTAEAAVGQYGFYVNDADGNNAYSTGDTVLFGSYPQGYVEDNEILVLLKEQEGTLPDANGKGDWNDYGYYDEGEVSSYMFYKDVTVGEKRYRGVYLLDYRSYYSWLAAGGDYSYIDDEGWELETVYWFEYAPISWTVLDYIDGKLLLNSLSALDAQPLQARFEYDAESKMAYIPATQTYVNDWAESTVRSFLNGMFCNTAFGDREKALLASVTLDNRTTGYAADAKYQAAQENTEDKVFLLSYQDYLNTDYGFPDTVDYDSPITKDKQDPDSIPDAQLRRRTFTDYSTIQGLHRSTVAHTATGENACTYLMRSCGLLSYSVCSVSKYGSLTSSGGLNVYGTDSYDTFACNGNLGLVPTVYLEIK